MSKVLEAVEALLKEGGESLGSPEEALEAVEEVQRLLVKLEKYRRTLHKKAAEQFSPVKVGQVVSNGRESIKVQDIRVESSWDYEIVWRVYGPLVRKDGQVYDNNRQHTFVLTKNFQKRFKIS